MTTFSQIYDSFLSKITDDMYMEMSELDTYRMLEELLLSAVQWFQFPRVDLNDYELCSESSSTYCGVDSNNQEVQALSLYDCRVDKFSTCKCRKCSYEVQRF